MAKGKSSLSAREHRQAGASRASVEKRGVRRWRAISTAGVGRWQRNTSRPRAENAVTVPSSRSAGACEGHRRHRRFCQAEPTNAQCRPAALRHWWQAVLMILAFCDLPTSRRVLWEPSCSHRWPRWLSWRQGLSASAPRRLLRARKARGVKLGEVTDGARALRGKQKGNREAVAAIGVSRASRARAATFVRSWRTYGRGGSPACVRSPTNRTVVVSLRHAGASGCRLRLSGHLAWINA